MGTFTYKKKMIVQFYIFINFKKLKSINNIQCHKQSRFLQYFFCVAKTHPYHWRTV